MKLNSISLRSTRPGPRGLIIAGVHGDELEPMLAVQRLASLISPGQLSGELTLVPCINEAARRRRHRVADDGLDLARTCPGDADGSITQQVAAAVTALIREHDFLIDLHTGGVLFRLCPLAGYMIHNNPGVLAAQRHMAQAFGMPLSWGTSAELNGRTLSVARDAGIPAIYAEFGGGGFNPAVIDAYINACKGVLAERGAIDEHVTPLCAVPETIEDSRDQSGVLQVQHPSPVDGYFNPIAPLGKRTKIDDEIGFVEDERGGRRIPVRAAESGVLVMLREWRYVVAGDALAAIASTGMKGTP